MAQLHEYQAKMILASHGIAIPSGELASTPDAACKISEKLGEVVIKAQVHSTSRAAAGGIKFARTPSEARDIAEKMLDFEIAGSRVECILIDQRLAIAEEFYLGFVIDDRKKRPTLLLSIIGGSGIEDRPDSIIAMDCSVRLEPDLDKLEKFVESGFGVVGLDFEVTNFSYLRSELAVALLKLYRAARSCDARMAEINPFARLADGSFVAVDARISVDDYAVFRHPGLGIDMARELGHTPTKLEQIAWEVEKEDFRGTFYFVEILDATSSAGALIGFHGAGGGGSMASLDAAKRNSLEPACYVDTSGNPPASKVYRAARIILSIPEIRGYFLSGSGVASQEQSSLARAVMKAFLEVRPQFPAVLRLGGNGEDEARDLVERYASQLPFPVEAYGKGDSADACAGRLRELIEAAELRGSLEEFTKGPSSFGGNDIYRFATRTGTVSFVHDRMDPSLAQAIVDSCPQNILMLSSAAKPVLAIDPDEAKRGKCSECLACEFAALDRGSDPVRIDFPILGL